jgi:hypothetical protein
MPGVESLGVPLRIIKIIRSDLQAFDDWLSPFGKTESVVVIVSQLVSPNGIDVCFAILILVYCGKEPDIIRVLKPAPDSNLANICLLGPSTELWSPAALE